jgi:anthranilate synthase/aminodeoxychorismate synthase-like glutamine amidotransferase
MRVKNHNILVIDNFDPSTENLVQNFVELGAEVAVYRNDDIGVDQIEHLTLDRIILSHGPGYPADAGITREVVKTFHGTIPILGICLGHLAIGEVYGAKVIEAPELLTDKASYVHHDRSLLFSGMFSTIKADICHSIILDKETIPENIRTSAWTENGLVMGIQVVDTLTFGIQFRPDSPLTPKGHTILKNFLNCTSRQGT